MPNNDQKPQGWSARFERYKKEYVIKSEPSDYVHVGLNSAAQFSDLISDIETELRSALEGLVPPLCGDRELAEFPEMECWNDCAIEILRRIEQRKKDLGLN